MDTFPPFFGTMSLFESHLCLSTLLVLSALQDSYFGPFLTVYTRNSFTKTAQLSSTNSMSIRSVVTGHRYKHQLLGHRFASGHGITV